MPKGVYPRKKRLKRKYIKTEKSDRHFLALKLNKVAKMLKTL